MTPPVPSRETPAGRAYNDLRNLARREGRPASEYFTLYALEGFLDRLARSEHSSDFALKGGVLMATFGARRPTRDVDLAASGIANDIPDVVGRVREILETDLDDGLEFDTESIQGSVIREGSGDAPADFSDLLVACVAFADPVLARGDREMIWQPGNQAWQEVD